MAIGTLKHKKSLRLKDDFYPTPAGALVPILDQIGKHRLVFDPSAGDGALLDVASRLGCKTHGIELDLARRNITEAKGHACAWGDALHFAWPSTGIILMNPPWSHKEAFIRKALAHLDAGLASQVAVIMRCTYLEPVASRVGLDRTPNVIHIGRPAYIPGNKSGDALHSVWILWPGEARVSWQKTY
jgi:hypothetical protein